MIEPGRPRSLGRDEDLADAAGLVLILQGCHEMRERRNAGTSHVARQALWSFWELPRLPKPLLHGKYPKRYPWSAEAAALYLASPMRPAGGWGLVLEHLTPANLLMADLIKMAPKLTPRKLINRLDKRLVATVITKREDNLLIEAGVGTTLPANADPDDLWARYRLARLDPDTFAPLLDEA